MNRASTAPLNSGFTVLTVICGAFLFSLVVYVGVAWVLLRSGGTFSPVMDAVPSMLPPALLVSAVMLLVAAHILGRTQGDGSAATMEGQEAFASWQQRNIVAFALREAVAILGLVLTLLSGDIRWVVGLAVTAAVAMLAGWPRRPTAGGTLRSGPPPIG